MPREGYKPEQSNVALWPNDRKQREQDPDLTGTAQIVDEDSGEVTEYWANAWENNDGGRGPVLRIKLKRKDGGGTHVASRRHDPTTAPRTGPNSSYPHAPGKRYGTRPRPSNMQTWEEKHGNSRETKPPHDFEDDIPF